MLSVLGALCGSGFLFLLLIFCLNFGSLTFFLVREDLGKILKFEKWLHISDTWITFPSHDFSDLSGLNWPQIQLWVLLLIQLSKEKNMMLQTIYAFLCLCCNSICSFPLNFNKASRMEPLKSASFSSEFHKSLERTQMITL